MSIPTMDELKKRGRHVRAAFPQCSSSWGQVDKLLRARGLRQVGTATMIRSGVYLVTVEDFFTGEARGERTVALKNNKWTVTKP